LSRQARAALLRHDWPGNVRELRNVVEAICLLRAGKQVRVRELPEALHPAGPPAEASASMSVDLEQPLDKIIEQVIRAALAAEKGNRSRAAERLGVSVRTIQRHVARGMER
jgi:DNA-binding NtrC family response regulator